MLRNIFFGGGNSVFSDISSAIIFVFMAVIIAILPLRSGHIKLGRFEASFQISCFQRGFFICSIKRNIVISRQNCLEKNQDANVREFGLILEHITQFEPAVSIFYSNTPTK